MKKKYFPPQCTVICIESGHLLAGTTVIDNGNGNPEKPIPDTPEEAGAKEWIFMDDSDIWD